MNFTYRMHDPRIGRFFAVDPLFREYPYNSTYAFQENKLGLGTELEGKELQLHYWLSVDAAVNPNGVGAHVIGFGDSAAESLTGLWDAARNPKQTAKAMVDATVWVAVGSQFSDKVDSVLGTNSTGAGDAILNGVVSTGDNLINGNGQQRGKAVGDLTLGLLGSKGLDKLGKLSKLAVASRFATFISPKLIRFTQKTMNGPKFDKLVQSMKAKGWQGDAIDVVKMKDDLYTSLDNKRLAAAQDAGIEAKVNVHNYDDVFPEARAKQFEKQYKVKPKTYGEAAKLRIDDQSGGFGKKSPNGSYEKPKASGYGTTN
jgi:hypothetical protein